MAAKPKREVSLARENKAWELTCRGWNQYQIAAHLGITQQAVSHLLKLARERSKVDSETRLLDFVGQLDLAQREAVAAWFRSKKPIRRRKEVTDEKGETTEVIEYTERNGSVAYLHTAFAAMDRKAKVLGLNVADAPQEQNFTIASLTGEIAERRKIHDSRNEEVQASDTGEPTPGAGSGDIEMPQ